MNVNKWLNIGQNNWQRFSLFWPEKKGELRSQWVTNFALSELILDHHLVAFWVVMPLLERVGEAQSAFAKGLFLKVTGFNRGHFFIIYFSHFQRWLEPRDLMNIHGRQKGQEPRNEI